MGKLQRNCPFLINNYMNLNPNAVPTDAEREHPLRLVVSDHFLAFVGVELLAEHQAHSFGTSSVYTDLASPDINPTTAMLSANSSSVFNIIG